MRLKTFSIVIFDRGIKMKELHLVVDANIGEMIEARKQAVNIDGGNCE